LDVPLPEPGTYHVVFDNSFSLLTAKNVSAKISLAYEQESLR